jgi:cell division transport system ATP-binding protein
MLIVADEPTGNLDPETSDEILLLLRKLSRQNNTAVLFATHDYRMLENFPARIIRCMNGRIFDDQELEI